jgi:GxxExxY protein
LSKLGLEVEKILMEMVVEAEVIVEIKSVKQLMPIHKAELFSYLKRHKRGIGLLINFNPEILNNSLIRM